MPHLTSARDTSSLMTLKNRRSVCAKIHVAEATSAWSDAKTVLCGGARANQEMISLGNRASKGRGCGRGNGNRI
jgi:hypothetical protein